MVYVMKYLTGCCGFLKNAYNQIIFIKDTHVMTYFDYSLKSKTLLRIIKDLSIRRRKVNIYSDEFVEIIRTIKQEGGYN